MVKITAQLQTNTARQHHQDRRVRKRSYRIQTVCLSKFLSSLWLCLGYENSRSCTFASNYSQLILHGEVEPFDSIGNEPILNVYLPMPHQNTIFWLLLATGDAMKWSFTTELFSHHHPFNFVVNFDNHNVFWVQISLWQLWRMKLFSLSSLLGKQLFF